MPRGKKAKRKRKAQKKAERERRFFNPPQTGRFSTRPVTADQYDGDDSSSSEEEYIAVTTQSTPEGEIVIDLVGKVSVGVPDDDTTPAFRPPLQVKNYRHIGIQTDDLTDPNYVENVDKVDKDDESEENISAATCPLHGSSFREASVSCDHETEEDRIVSVRVESTTEDESVDVEWIGDSDSSDSGESFEVRVQDLLPMIEDPPIDALTAVLEKIMNFKFDFKDVRESKSVSCHCYAGEGGKPSAREKYQEVRIRRVAHRIQRMRRFLEMGLSESRHFGNSKGRKTVEEVRTMIKEEMIKKCGLTEEEIRKQCRLAAVEESCPYCPVHRIRKRQEE